MDTGCFEFVVRSDYVSFFDPEDPERGEISLRIDEFRALRDLAKAGNFDNV
jgi:hypothetical protein